MKTKWVIQKNLINEEDLNSLIRVFKKYKIPYEAINIIPFERSLPKTTPHYGPVIAYGSTTLTKNVPPSWVWYNDETFKPSYWTRYYRYNMFLNSLNSDMIVIKFQDAWDYIKDSGLSRFFVRPDSDLKLFSGEVFMKGDFLDWYERTTKLIKTGTYVNLKLDTPICIAPYVPITREWRFFIVHNTVVAFSQYRENGRLSKSRIFDPCAYELARTIARNKRFQLAPGYVVDIALTNEGEYKIIEFNNFNSSGFYLCDVEQIILKANEASKILWHS